MTAASPPLDYAPRTSHRRRWRRFLILTTLLLVLTALGWQYRQAIVDRVNLLTAQRRCMTHTAPRDTVVFNEHHQRGPRLVASDPSYRDYQDGYTGFSSGPRRPQGTYQTFPAWERLAPYVLNAAGAPAFTPATLLAPRGLIFAHERRAPQRDARLVVVEVRADTHFRLIVHTLRPGGPFRTPVILKTNEVDATISDLLELGALFEDSTRIFAGQPDPDDPARFTFRADAHGVEIKAYGHLLSDDTVRLDVPDAAELKRQILKRPIQQ
jgi:hypothetical protein